MKRMIGFTVAAALLGCAVMLWISLDSEGERAAETAMEDAGDGRARALARPTGEVRSPETDPIRKVTEAAASDRSASAPAAAERVDSATSNSLDSSARSRPTDPDSRSAGPDLQEKIEAAGALPGEGRFLSEGHLDARDGMALLQSDTFGEAVDEMAWDASRDADAQALTDLYRDYVARSLAAGGGFVLDRIACGLRLCIGQALAIREDASWQVHGLYAGHLDGPPMYASTYNSFVTPEGRTFYRFMFTIDPSSPGIVVSGP